VGEFLKRCLKKMLEEKKIKVSCVMPVYNGEKYLRETIDSILNQTYSDFEFSTYAQEPLVTDLRGYTSDNQYNNFNTLVYFRLRLEYGISSDCNNPITKCDVYSNVLTIDYTPSKVLVNIRRGNYSTSDIELGVATGLPTTPQLGQVCKETKFYINCLISPQIFNEFTAGDLIKNADGSVFIGTDKWIALDYNIPNVNPKVCKVNNNGVIIAATSVGCQ
jgi:hypothetical protein